MHCVLCVVTLVLAKPYLDTFYSLPLKLTPNQSPGTLSYVLLPSGLNITIQPNSLVAKMVRRYLEPDTHSLCRLATARVRVTACPNSKPIQLGFIRSRRPRWPRSELLHFLSFSFLLFGGWVGLVIRKGFGEVCKYSRLIGDCFLGKPYYSSTTDETMGSI